MLLRGNAYPPTGSGGFPRRSMGTRQKVSKTVSVIPAEAERRAGIQRLNAFSGCRIESGMTNNEQFVN